ncbi:MAG: hypothetical protein IT579_08070 [Verrucomicrobia subdivision 3 bacterium]|nr:hypothetical protein [Limisphaerales bacterium]
MSNTQPLKGPWTHRLLVYFFSVLFGILIYWLLGFFMRDIGTWPGPNYPAIENRLGDPKLTQEAATVQNQIDEIKRATDSRQQQQKVVRDSTSNSEKTLNQLLELQKLTLQQAKTPAVEAAQALAESQRLFLANQTKYQEINDQITSLNEQLDTLENRHRTLLKQIEAQRPAIEAEFGRLQTRHNFKVAAGKLAVLLPLLGLAVWLFLKQRGNLYSPLVYGFGLALLVKVGQVMHEHFPTRYFKYILILIAIAVVTRILVFLLRAMAFPKLDWLLKQYREAYEHYFCPVCNYPIRLGPRQHLFWTRSSLKKLSVPATATLSSDEPYTCPVCATALFEACPACQRVRHSLLPACTHCGDTRQILQAPPGLKP